jgi:hypothetical protein
MEMYHYIGSKIVWWATYVNKEHGQTVTLTSTLASLIFVFLLHIRKTGKNQ